MPSEYGTYVREIEDRWTGAPMSEKRYLQIRWGQTRAQVLGAMDISPDVLGFQRWRKADGTFYVLRFWGEREER